MGKMPPPGGDSPGLAIMIGVPHGKDGKMPPPGMEDKPQGSGKASPDDAKVVHADQHCIDCQQYHPDTGDCDKVDGSFDPQDGCHMYFTEVADDEGAEGEPAEGGSDDQGPRGEQ